jgi:hypothetical protein
LDNKILSEQIKLDRKKTEQLKQKLEEQLKEGKREKTINHPDSAGAVGL